MRKGTGLSIYLILVSLVLICSDVTPGWAQAQEPVTFRLGSAYPPGIIPVQYTLRWQDQVTKATNGRFKFENLWLGSFCKPGECVGAVEKGLIDMLGDTWLYYVKQMPLNQWSFGIPFGPEDPRLMLKIGLEMWKRFPAMKEEIEKNNIKVLRVYSALTYNLVSKKPVRTVADLKGMKIGVGGIYLPIWMRAAGATPVGVMIPDRYTGMQTGIIEGSLLPIDNHDSIKLTEMGKHVTEINIGSYVMGFWGINRNTFNKLSPQDQNLLVSTAEQTSRDEMQFLWEEQARIMARWKAAGVNIHPFSREEKAKWAALLGESPFVALAKKMDSFGVRGKEFTQTFVNLCKENGFAFPYETQ